MKRDWITLPLRENPAGARWAAFPGPQYGEDGNLITSRGDLLGSMVCSMCGRPLPGWKSPIYHDEQVGAWGKRGRPIEQHPECGELWRAMNRFEEWFPQLQFADNEQGQEAIKQLAQWFWSHRNYLNVDTARVKKAIKAREG